MTENLKTIIESCSIKFHIFVDQGKKKKKNEKIALDMEELNPVEVFKHARERKKQPLSLETSTRISSLSC